MILTYKVLVIKNKFYKSQNAFKTSEYMLKCKRLITTIY